MYRVYDTESKKWIKNDIYLSPYPHSELYIPKKSFFGRAKLNMVSSEKYIIHKYIELNDRNGAMIFEGDYVKAQVDEDETIIGLVAYTPELSAYIVLCDETNEYFTLGNEVSKNIEVIGNVFDNKKEDKTKDK